MLIRSLKRSRDAYIAGLKLPNLRFYAIAIMLALSSISVSVQGHYNMPNNNVTELPLGQSLLESAAELSTSSQRKVSTVYVPGNSGIQVDSAFIV